MRLRRHDRRSRSRRAVAGFACLTSVAVLAVTGAVDRGDEGAPAAPVVRLAALSRAMPPVAQAARAQDGIPDVVLAAYRTAERTLARTQPRCGISWTLLAGVGRVESGHASGGRVDAAGTTRGPILGVTLNGSAAGVAAVPDTDRGRLDGDTVWDRAVGPMQFIPASWRRYAADGNGDALRSPHNVHDAALAAGRLLCAGGGDLSRPPAQRAALLRYNQSGAYVDLVLRWATAYAGGVDVVAPEAGSVPVIPPSPPERVPAPAVRAPRAAAARSAAAAVAAVVVEADRAERESVRRVRAERTAVERTVVERTVVEREVTEPVRTSRAAVRRAESASGSGSGSGSAARMVVEPTAGIADVASMVVAPER